MRLLCLASKSVREENPLHARNLAEAASTIAGALPDDYYPGGAVNHLRGLAWKELANACRYLGGAELPVALEALDLAEAAYERLLMNDEGLLAVRYTRGTVLWKLQRLPEALNIARAVASDSGLIDAVRAGEVDLTTALTMADVSANQITGMALSLQPGNSTGVLFFNCQRPALATAGVRRGISLALDVHELATRSFDKNPAAFLAPNLLPPMMGRPSGFPVLDRREANRLLDASGAKPKRLSLLVPWAPRPYLPKPLPLAQAVQRQLGEVGIAVDLRESKTSEQFFDDLVRGNYDMALAGWIADTPDPADFFETLLWSKNFEGERHSNLSRWKSPGMDAALARFRAEPTDTHKQEINKIIREEAPLLPLIYGQSVVVHSRKIRNVSMSPTGMLPLNAVTVS